MTYKKKRPRKAGLQGASGGRGEEWLKSLGEIPGWWYGLSHEGWICSLFFPGHELPTVTCWAQLFGFSPFNTADLFLVWSVIQECVSPRNQWTWEGLHVVLYLTLAFSFHLSYLKSATQLVCVNLTSKKTSPMFFGRLGSLFHRGELLGSDRGLSILAANFWGPPMPRFPPKMAFLIKGLLGMMIMFVGGMMQGSSGEIWSFQCWGCICTHSESHGAMYMIFLWVEIVKMSWTMTWSIT